MDWTKPYYGVSHCPARSKLADRRVSITDYSSFVLLRMMPPQCGFMRQSELDKAAPGQFPEDSVGFYEEYYPTVKEAKEAGERWLSGKTHKE